MPLTGIRPKAPKMHTYTQTSANHVGVGPELLKRAQQKCTKIDYRLAADQHFSQQRPDCFTIPWLQQADELATSCKKQHHEH